MRTLGWLFRIVVLSWLILPGASAQPQTATSLFNGKDLTGWEHVGPGRFVIQDGLLKTEGGMGLLWYAARQFGDGVLRSIKRFGGHRLGGGRRRGRRGWGRGGGLPLVLFLIGHRSCRCFL